MKQNLLNNVWLLAAMLFVALCPPVAAQEEEKSPIEFTFAGRGDSKIVESVTVTNLTHPEIEPLTLSGTDILYLADKETITPIESVQERVSITQPILTPNPSLGVDGTLIFDAQSDGPVRVSMYSQGGMLLEAAVLNVTKGRNTARIPLQTTGIYIVNIEGQGVKSSTRWICSGSKSFGGITLGGAAQWADYALPVKEIQKSPMQTRAAQVNTAYMEYNEGDILRFDGTSGQLRTIMHASPIASGNITFDFYRCQDTSGYNYPIVRAGDLLWMMEDLHPQALAEITRTNMASLWKSTADHAPAMFLSQGKAYYNIHAARLAMPEGWRVPTIDEVQSFVKALKADTEVLGDFVKDRDYNWRGSLIEGPDTIHLQLQPNGYINPQGKLTESNVTGAWLTRNTINHGNPVAFEVYANDSQFYPQVEHEKGCGFLLRGCRPTSSVYAEVIDSLFKDKNDTEQPMQLVNGPIGNYYTFGADRFSVFFDYSSWGDANDNRHSGILYKNHNSAGWKTDGKQLVPLDVNGADPMHHLRKVAAQVNGDGYEDIVYATWSNPFRVHTAPLLDGGSGVVNVTIFGDAEHNHAIYDGYASRPLLDKDGNEFVWVMPWSGLSTSTRPTILDGVHGWYLSDLLYQYYARAFNLNCIQDQTEDGVDEIVVSVGNKIAVFDGVTLRCIREKTFSSERNLRFDVADVTGDGLEDIVLITTNWSGNYIRLEVYDQGHVNENAVFYHFINQRSRFFDVKVGKMSGESMPEIAVLTRGCDDNNSAVTTTHNYGYLNIYRLFYDESQKLQAKTILEGQKVNCFPSASWNESTQLSGNLNLVFGYFRGHSYNQDLIVGDGLWRWDYDEGKPVWQFQMLPEVMEIAPRDPSLTYVDACTISADAITSVQLRRGDKESLLFFKDRYLYSNTYNPHSNTTLVEKWLGDDGTTVLTNETLCSSKFGWTDEQNTRQMNTKNGTENLAHPVLCKFADREMTKYFKLVKHEKSLSEPHISAVIAAPPYYEDLGVGGETSWGHTKSSGISEVTSDTWGGSVIVGYEYEFSMPFFSSVNAGVEFTAKVSGDYTSATGEETVLSYGHSFQAAGANQILMEATPYDTYTYEIVGSGNPDDIGMTFVLSVPRSRLLVPISFEDYERLLGNQRDVPHPHWMISSTPGDPWSYPTAEDYVNDPRIIQENTAYPFLKGMVNGSEANQSAGSGDGSATRTISLAKNVSETSSVEIGVETELVGKVNGVKAGVGFNYSHNKENTRTIGSELTVSGTVQVLPSLFDPKHPNFKWNLVWYYVRDGKDIYPVVNYIVTK